MASGNDTTTPASAPSPSALRLNPDFADAHLNLGNVLMQAGRPAEAITQYELALRLQPDLAEACGNLGYALAREDRIDEAIRQYEALVWLEPDNAEARQALTWLRALPPGGRQPEKQSGQPRRIGLSCCSFAAPSCSSPPPCAS